MIVIKGVVNVPPPIGPVEIVGVAYGGGIDGLVSAAFKLVSFGSPDPYTPLD